ncbi:MAG: hypothetical protein LBL24_03540 [Bacteroidales bacterium]|jgi:hypothetical protein|nr:hypothetical protein [Bacteroidales bacterium]
MAYIEAKASENDNENSGKPLFDMVILFAVAARQIDEENEDVTLEVSSDEDPQIEEDKTAE